MLAFCEFNSFQQMTIDNYILHIASINFSCLSLEYDFKLLLTMEKMQCLRCILTCL